MDTTTTLLRLSIGALVGCASATPVAPTTPESAVAAAARAPRPDPPGTRRFTRPAWSLAVPQDWDETEETNGITYRPPGGAQPGSATFVVGEIPYDGATLEAMRVDIGNAYQTRGMRMTTHREGSSDGHPWLEVHVEPTAALNDMHMLGYTMVSGNRFAWALCAAPTARWDAAREGCEATLATLVVNARPPAAPAGRRRVGNAGITVAVPTSWVDRRNDHDATWEVMASENGADTDPMQVVVTGGDLGVPRAELLDRIVDGLQRDGYVASDRARRTVPGGAVDTVTLTKHQEVPDVHLAQRVLISGSRAYILTCGGPTALYGSEASPCAPMFEGFRLAP